MKFRPENKCSFCAKLFCCLQCRVRHEIKVHFTLFAEFISCDLCSGAKGIILQQENKNEFIDHLFIKHLPLQCRNCSVIFNNKIDLATLHTCMPSNKAENEKMNSKMGLGEEKIKPILEENEQENEHEKDAEFSGNIKQTDEFAVVESGKQKTKSFDGSVAENGALIPTGLSINNSDNSDHTHPSGTPMTTNLVRQTSTPMTKVLHEVKRRSYESMSASSIQMSSIDNCSSEHDISPPVPSATSNLHTFKQPSRRMPVGVTPYRQIMSKSIQRAFNVQGLSRGRYVDSTPPLDLRTSPVIRRTITMEGRPRAMSLRANANMIDLRTTPVIRRSRQLEGINIAAAIDAHIDQINGTLNEYEHNRPANQNIQNALQESLQKSALSRSKSTNTFFETCRSFESSVTSSNPIAETPKTTGIAKRTASITHRKIAKGFEEEGENWSSSAQENVPADAPLKSSVEPLNEMNKNEVKDEVEMSQPVGILWSLVSSVWNRLGSTGGSSIESSNTNSDGTSLIKRCASFTGILPRKPKINSENDENPFKRRRTTTLSKVESYNKLGEEENGSGKRVHRISGRPPIDRMRQS